jgi:hypothetical protein
MPYLMAGCFFLGFASLGGSVRGVSPNFVAQCLVKVGGVPGAGSVPHAEVAANGFPWIFLWIPGNPHGFLWIPYLVAGCFFFGFASLGRFVRGVSLDA